MIIGASLTAEASEPRKIDGLACEVCISERAYSQAFEEAQRQNELNKRLAERLGEAQGGLNSCRGQLLERGNTARELDTRLQECTLKMQELSVELDVLKKRWSHWRVMSATAAGFGFSMAGLIFYEGGVQPASLIAAGSIGILGTVGVFVF